MPSPPPLRRARRSVVLPEGSDPVAVAAAMNPAMSAWMALRRRIRFERGQRVLVLGATGSAGRLAIQVARLCGASRVIAAGRDPARLVSLAALGADDLVSLAGPADAVPLAEVEQAWRESASIPRRIVLVP